MEFYNLKNKKEIVGLEYAVLNSIGKNSGLYYPQKIPQDSLDNIKNYQNYSYNQIVQHYSKILFNKEVDINFFENIYSFEPKIVKLSENLHILELFHGPTLSFKDYGAKYLANLLSIFDNSKKKLVLVATSGDTGSAVANGFYSKKNVNVAILYPKNKVSKLQEKQLNTLGKNILAISVEGTFDDCQEMVKRAFLDEDLKNKFSLVSANSINVGRFLPQAFYYIYAISKIKNNKNINVVVPSGNFGNITSAIMANKIAKLNIEMFHAACNSNKTVPDFFKTNEFWPRYSVKTISNAMDVGNPSNFPRMMEYYKNNISELKKNVNSISYSDQETKNSIVEVKNKYGYIMCPHTAVGYCHAKKLLEQNKKVLLVATAHPAKFIEVYDKLNIKIDIPKQLDFSNKKSNFIEIKKGFSSLKQKLV